jgi:hypothetical protein
MIGMGFSRCPPFLWITLCKSCGEYRQVLDSAPQAVFCLFSQQDDLFNKIKYLRRDQVIFAVFVDGHWGLPARFQLFGDKSSPEHALAAADDAICGCFATGCD